MVWSPALLSPGDTLTAEEVNTLLSGPYYVLHASSAQSIANSANTPLSFGSVVEYNSRYSAVSTPATAVVAPVDGLYLAMGSATFAANATGYRAAWLSMDGTSVGGAQDPGSASAPWAAQVVGIQSLSAGDQISLCVYQNCTAALNTSPATLSGCSLTVRWIGL
jgi:hypothetical protein